MRLKKFASLNIDGLIAAINTDETVTKTVWINDLGTVAVCEQNATPAPANAARVESISTRADGRQKTETTVDGSKSTSYKDASGKTITKEDFEK